MFNFFRRKAKEKPQGEEVKFSELRQWLDKSSYTTLVRTQFQNEIKEYINGLTESLSKIGPSLEQLKANNLESRKVDERVKGIVLQNKIVYVGQVTHLIELINAELEKISNQQDLTFDGLKRAAGMIMLHLNNFSKQSFKSFHITSELIGKELEQVVKGIAEIDGAVKKIGAMDSAKIAAIENINKKIEELAKTEQSIESLRSAIAEKVKENEDICKKILDAEKRNEEIRKSSEWDEKQNLIANISALNEQLKKNSADATSMFMAIEKALKKWAWKEKDDSALGYIENPIAATRQKGYQEAIEMLTKIKEGVTKGELEIEDKRKNQMIQNISAITKEKLESFIAKEDALRKEIETAEQELSRSHVKFIDMAAMITQKGYVAAEIAKLGKKRGDLEQEIKEKKNGLIEALKALDITLIDA